MSTDSLASNAVDGAPDLFSEKLPLIDIFKYLDSTSLQQLRLTCHLLKQSVDKTITSFTLGTAGEYNRIEDVQYEITRAALLWPGIKKITKTLRRFETPRGVEDMP